MEFIGEGEKEGRSWCWPTKSGNGKGKPHIFEKVMIFSQVWWHMAYNLSPWKAYAGGSQVRIQPKPCFKNSCLSDEVFS